MKKIIITLTIILTISIAAVFALTSTTKTNSIPADEMKKMETGLANKQGQDRLNMLAEIYKTPKETLLKMKAELGNWDDVATKLLVQSKSFSKEKIDEPYKQGYGIKDMAKAEELALIGDKNPEDILKEKGRIQNNKKAWADVEKKFGIDSRKPSEKLGLTKAKIDDLKKQGLDDKTIEESALLASNYNKDINSITTEVKKGKKTKELGVQYSLEKTKNMKLTKEQLNAQDTALETMIKSQHGLKDTDIINAKNNGVTGTDIAVAKEIAKKYKVSFDDVIKLKNGKEWTYVVEKLGGKK